MKTNQRGFVAGGAWLSAGFALLLGCSASDHSSSDVGSSQEELHKAPPAPAKGHPQPRPQFGHGHGHDSGHGHGHGPCDDDGHGGPGTGSGGSGGGSSTGSGGSSTASGGSSSSNAGSSSSAGSSSGGASSAGNGSGGFGGGAPAVCGDSMWGGNEQCDDGNAISGDGCSSECQLEPHYACDVQGAPCQAVVCGDGKQQSFVHADGTYAYEACDDGNVASGDGCDSTCGIEPGWICEQPGMACREPTCGDGRQDSWFVPGPDGGVGGSSGLAGSGSGGSGPGGTYFYEECDDGNAVSGDGCTSTCTTEAGWLCPQPGVACHQPVCGDGIVDFIAGPGNVGGGGTGGSGSTGSAGSGVGGGYSGGAFEGCDDGNTVPGDGCDPSCSVEAGWSCPYWEGPCHRTVCGDGFADYPAEQCDDGNSIPNDGCTSCTWDNQGGGGFGGGFTGGAFTGGFGGLAGGSGGSFTGGTGGTR